MSDRPLLAITMRRPAGVGPEVVVKALGAGRRRAEPPSAVPW